MRLSATVLVAGSGSGALLRLTAPISFWGGVDPDTGFISDPRHPQFGCAVAGRVLAVECLVGSSSGSSVMLELIDAGRAPAALILTEPDCIVTLGAVVARAMGLRPPPIVRLAPAELALLDTFEGRLQVNDAGDIFPDPRSGAVGSE